jgi:hypothetical protein
MELAGSVIYPPYETAPKHEMKIDDSHTQTIQTIQSNPNQSQETSYELISQIQPMLSHFQTHLHTPFAGKKTKD